jgi:thymidylate synthase (FAD)
MNISLLTNTPSPARVMWVAYRTCYSKFTPQQLWKKAHALSDERIESFIAEMFKTKHASPQRHVNFTFGVSGISRVLSHQLVRHTVGVPHSQQSQRYVDGRNFGNVTPPYLRGVAEAEFHMHMNDCGNAYERLQDLDIPNEDARFVLPGATTTNLTTSFSYEALRNFCHKRLCSQAQWEARFLAAKLKSEVKTVSPFLAAYLVPACHENADGMCTEPYKKFTQCPSKRPHKEDLLKLWNTYGASK